MALAKPLVLIAMLGLALAAPAAASSPSSLHLIAHGTQASPFDDRHAVLGDMQSGSGALLDARRRNVGRFSFTCVAAGIEARYVLEQCNATGSLSGGQITLAGMASSNTNVQRWAVTGGTGIYSGARGEARLHDLGPRETVVDVSFAP
jgi:hypothetical protein